MRYMRLYGSHILVYKLHLLAYDPDITQRNNFKIL
jgi:hypothetical protein